MGSLLIRHVDDALRDRLKDNARAHRRSLEEEARELLRGALAGQARGDGATLSGIARRCFAGGVDLDLPARSGLADRPPVDVGEAGYDR